MRLALQKPYMRGSAVKRLQELCDLLVFDTGDNDGIFGPQTRLAVLKVQEFCGIKIDGVCGPETWAALLKHTQILANIEHEYLDTETDILVDRRGMHKRPRLYSYGRSWESIEGVTLHQTGCAMPQNPQGWDRLNAHIGITQSGLCIITNDCLDMIWHAQGLSKTTIGIEIEGNYYGIDGVPWTLWKPGGGPHHLNDKMHAALAVAFGWIKNQFAIRHQTWSRIAAHRQSSKNRIADPGQEIWRQVALPWSEQLGLRRPGTNDQFGSGRCVPREWDPRSEYSYRS